MPGCAVISCKNYNLKTEGSGVIYHTFPSDDDDVNKWLYACRRKQSEY